MQKIIQSNSPLKDVPADYVPEGVAYKWFKIDQGYDAGKTMFYWDHVFGEGAPRQTYLFVHGNPESSYTYRQVMDHLIHGSPAAIRIIAMDHIGFGLSDQADFEMVEIHHAANLSQLVRHLDLTDISLVVHDWGGPIGVGAFLEDPSRVKSLSMMNTTIFPMPGEGLVYPRFPIPYLIAWTHMARFVPAGLWKWIPPMVIYSPGSRLKFIGHSIKFIARALAGRMSTGERAYQQMFSVRANALSSKRIAMQTGVWGHGYQYKDPVHGRHDTSVFYTRIQSELVPTWVKWIKVSGAFGLFDPAGKKPVQQQWLKNFPQMKDHIQTFEGVGHFVEEHRPREIAAGILQLLEK